MASAGAGADRCPPLSYKVCGAAGRGLYLCPARGERGWSSVVADANAKKPPTAPKDGEVGGLPGDADYALIFSLAVPASVLNAAMSFTARSARILRFTSMPASFRPCISLL